MKVGIQRSNGLKFVWIPLIHWEVVRKGIVFDYTGCHLHEREELGRGCEPPLNCWKAFGNCRNGTPFISARLPVLFGIFVDAAELVHKRNLEDSSWSRALWQVDASGSLDFNFLSQCLGWEKSFDEFSSFFKAFRGLLIGRDILQKGSSEHEESCTLLRWLATNSTRRETQCLLRNRGSGANSRMTVWQESRV